MQVLREELFVLFFQDHCGVGVFTVAADTVFTSSQHYVKNDEVKEASSK